VGAGLQFRSLCLQTLDSVHSYISVTLSSTQIMFPCVQQPEARIEGIPELRISQSVAAIVAVKSENTMAIFRTFMREDEKVGLEKGDD
jgi:hypothetical protein